MLITQERLKEVAHYNPETGIFTRLKRTGNNNGCNVGKEMGHIDKGYKYVAIDFRRYPLHRLAWLYMTGDHPQGVVDHINGNKIDNRFCNLRDVPAKVNSQNYHAPQKNNKSGFLGVHYVSRPKVNNPYNPWRAAITENGKRMHLGYFATPELAHEAYLEAKRKYHQGCTI
jgi:hypothetical protein